ncbi:hypothetical protein [Brevibacterium casei]|uniref:hypothetical protein n=1 Tax=Brevibacterium casei TaxID=33889 RepID=UPI0028AB22B0|nr:hypothetical protein [Brevibacterium casei]
MSTPREINVTAEVFEQIADTYRRMSRMKFRPAIQGDWFGYITIPAAELDIEQEIADYAEMWMQDEDSDHYFLGCPDFGDRPALTFIVEAARQLNGQSHAMTVALLKAAIADIESRKDARR